MYSGGGQDYFSLLWIFKYSLDEIVMENLGKVGVDIPEDDQTNLVITFNQFLRLMEELTNFDMDIDEEKLMQYIK